MNELLGPCHKRLGFDRYCGITLMATPNGPGHVSRPAMPHYPVVRKTTGAPSRGSADATVDGAR